MPIETLEQAIERVRWLATVQPTASVDARDRLALQMLLDRLEALQTAAEAADEFRMLVRWVPGMCSLDDYADAQEKLAGALADAGVIGNAGDDAT